MEKNARDRPPDFRDDTVWFLYHSTGSASRAAGKFQTATRPDPSFSHLILGIETSGSGLQIPTRALEVYSGGTGETCSWRGNG